MTDQKTCYVIMPFSPTKRTKNWESVYQNLFRPVIEESKFGYKCERSEIRNGAFTKDIVQNLKTAHLVLADITDLNPNVMWELGVRHALSQRTIMVAREDAIDEIPSDIRGYGVIAYPKEITGFKKFKEEIEKTLTRINNEPERGDNPVFDFLNIEDLILNSIQRQQSANKLKGLLSELLRNLKIANDLVNGILPMTPENITLRRFYTNAIHEILGTNYISVKENFLSDLFTALLDLENVNMRLDVATFNKEDRAVTIKSALEGTKPLKPLLEQLIKDTKKVLSSIQTSDFKLSESPVFVFGEEYRKYLD